MIVRERLPAMAEQHRTTRNVAGDIVKLEMDRQRGRFRNPQGLADAAGISRSSVYNTINGEPKVESLTLRALEGALDLPRYLLDHIIAGNLPRITDMARLDGRRLPPDLLMAIEDGLRSIAPHAPAAKRKRA